MHTQGPKKFDVREGINGQSNVFGDNVTADRYVEFLRDALVEIYQNEL